jgi:hypothetical protein
MSAEVKEEIQLEIAHVLLNDVLSGTNCRCILNLFHRIRQVDKKRSQPCLRFACTMRLAM